MNILMDDILIFVDEEREREAAESREGLKTRISGWIGNMRQAKNTRGMPSREIRSYSCEFSPCC